MRRSNDATPASAGKGRPASPEPSDPETPAKATRRRFTAAYKASILEEADRCESPGDLGRLLKREGLYHSHLATWRKAARKAILDGLDGRRGPKPKSGKAWAAKLRRLERESERLREENRKLRIVAEAQKKVAGLLGIKLEGERSE